MVDEQDDSFEGTDMQYGFHRASTDRKTQKIGMITKIPERSVHSNEGI